MKRGMLPASPSLTSNSQSIAGRTRGDAGSVAQVEANIPDLNFTADIPFYARRVARS
jgi:hypothetical protein